MHTRRSLLRAAGLCGVAGLAGCTAVVGDGPSLPGLEDPGTRPSERDHPPDATHRAAVAATDAPPDLPVEPHVSLADPFVTAGSPVVLRVDVENPTDGAVTVGEYRSVVFQYGYSTDGTLVWLPHSERSTDGEPDRSLPDYAVSGEGCWWLEEHVAITMEYGSVEIPARGTLTAFVGLYATPDATTCTPTGDHRFETAYTHFRNGIPGDGDDSRSETWGFILSVEGL